MSIFREFFNWRIFLNCLIFALPIGFLCMWRVVYVQDISFFSIEAAKIFLFLVVMIFAILRFFLFVLYLLSRNT